MRWTIFLKFFLDASAADKIQSSMSRDEATRAARFVYAHGWEW
jgi:hypothetical protein